MLLMNSSIIRSQRPYVEVTRQLGYKHCCMNWQCCSSMKCNTHRHTNSCIRTLLQVRQCWLAVCSNTLCTEHGKGVDMACDYSSILVQALHLLDIMFKVYWFSILLIFNENFFCWLVGSIDCIMCLPKKFCKIYFCTRVFHDMICQVSLGFK